MLSQSETALMMHLAVNCRKVAMGKNQRSRRKKYTMEQQKGLAINFSYLLRSFCGFFVLSHIYKFNFSFDKGSLYLTHPNVHKYHF